ncbi:MAG TPA: PPC domain-containing protein [Gemmataceae bacterium]|nr:PPC domain-containing protein [Gemmataceae bacterium]
MKSCWRRALPAAVFAFLLAAQFGAAGDKEKEKSKDKEKEQSKNLVVDAELTQNDVRDKVRTQSYCRTYKFKMVEGKAYQIDMKSKEFDSYLRLEDANGTQVAFDDDSGDFRDARIIYRANKTGEFTIICTSFSGGNTGKFQLLVNEKGAPAVAAKAKALAFIKGKNQVSVTAKLQKDDAVYKANRPGKFFLVTLEAGKSYQIDMKSKAFDSYLYLEDADGIVVAQDDDSGGFPDARITYRPTKTGRFRIIASHYGFQGEGEFTLTVQREEK